MKTAALTHRIFNFVDVKVLPQPMYRLTVEVIGIDLTSFLSSRDCKWPDSSKYIIQHITTCERLDNPLVLGG